QGHPVDWAPLFPRARTVDLPTYPFQHQHYWLDVPPLFTASSAAQDGGWRYRVDWRWLGTRDSGARLSGRWLLLVPESDGSVPWVEGAEKMLAERGCEVVSVPIAATADRDAMAEAVRESVGDGRVDGVLSLLALDGRPHPDAAAVPTGLVAAAQAVQVCDELGIGSLWVATRQAVSVDGADGYGTGGTGKADNPADADQAAVWGLGRVAALEKPQLWGGLVDLPATADERMRDLVAQALTAPDAEDQVAVRADGVAVRRLVRSAAPAPAHDWQPSGTVLVTGGTGGVGANVARWLVTQDIQHLLLVSRRGPDAPGAAELLDELSASGTPVTIEPCDVTDADAVRRLIGSVPAERPLSTVFHAAGVLDDCLIDALTPQRLAAVLEVKAKGALILHEAAEDAHLVFFSSLAGTTGTKGQGNYAAANAYLDALAERRRADGLPATSVAWGAWQGAGMVADAAVAHRTRRYGLPLMSPDRAVATLRQVMAEPVATQVVADVDWQRFVADFTAVRPSRLLADLPEVCSLGEQRQDGQEGQGAQDADLVSELAALPETDRRRAMLDLVQELVLGVLGHETRAAIGPDSSFHAIGFDSLTAVELRNLLAVRIGLKLPATLVYDHPTLASLADHLHEQLAVDEGHMTDTADGLLAELDALAAKLAAAGLDPEARTRIGRRLKDMQAACEPRAESSRDLKSASRTEVLDFLTNELGISR
ncbi:beta-ketoacyl reductase, partial [Streptomyces sp. NPDC007000]|uniref:beta-ketoacyl reductase n=1 Tax=Streptomyces sp. NPDC007000 TaxID=3155357 RepID=UPI0033F2317C